MIDESTELDLTIVIVNWNTSKLTRDCIASIIENTHGINYEIVVVDNNSSDTSVQDIRDQFPNVELVENDTNVGFPAANNVVLMRERLGEFVLLLNSDTIVLNDAIQKTLIFFSSQQDWGMVSCKVVNKDLSLQPNCKQLPSLLNLCLFVLALPKVFPGNRFFGRERMTWFKHDEAREVDVIAGCFMLVRVEALRQVGLMDDGFFMYFEEDDWCARYRAAGWKVGFYPDSKIIHLGGESAAQLGGQRAIIKDTSTLRYMRKHWSTPERVAGYLLMVTFYISRLPPALVGFLLTGRSQYRKTISNHWYGLKGLIFPANTR